MFVYETENMQVKFAIYELSQDVWKELFITHSEKF